MRGKPPLTETSPVQLRIIPAHAGQTLPYFARGMVYADHPRACGANAIMASSESSHVGSSPRMRGKLDDLRDMLSRVRIIPAHAGQTGEPYVMRTGMPDHPRACGANLRSFVLFAGDCGSSPRMRGKRPVIVR